MKATKFSQFLQSREELKFVDKPHWIYVVEAAIWSIFIVVAGAMANQLIVDTLIYSILNDNINADGFLVNSAAYAAYAVL